MTTDRITTVLGPAAPEQLGFCHCHEHLMLKKGPSYDQNPVLCIEDLDKSTEEVRRFRQAGGGTIIEAQPVGCGRMADALVKISQQTGVLIIASTGFHKLCFYSDNHWIHNSTEAELTRLFITELTSGMFIDGDELFPALPSTAKAGIIKAAYDSEELSPRYQRLFGAAAAAALSTGRVMSIHIEPNTDPLSLLAFLTDHGMDPRRLIFCHMDRACHDLNIHKKVLEAGVYLEYDTIGRFKYHSDEREIEIIKEIADSGYAGQLLFSLDTTRARLKTYTPDAIGLDYILTTFLPRLLAAGITSEQAKLISHTNCCRIFTD